MYQKARPADHVDIERAFSSRFSVMSFGNVALEKFLYTYFQNEGDFKTGRQIKGGKCPYGAICSTMRTIYFNCI